jgi:hypothetical protein
MISTSPRPGYEHVSIPKDQFWHFDQGGNTIQTGHRITWHGPHGVRSGEVRSSIGHVVHDHVEVMVDHEGRTACIPLHEITHVQCWYRAPVEEPALRKRIQYRLFGVTILSIDKPLGV